MSATRTLPAALDRLTRVALAAGAVIMRHYAAGSAYRLKADRSPVTDADEEAERLILAALAEAAPGLPVVAEEEAAAGRKIEAGSHFFLVDPLDGTREFLNRNGEFTVNIAEIKDGVPRRGVVFAPALDRLFAGEVGTGTFESDAGLSVIRAIRARPAPEGGMVAVASRSHRDPQTEAYLAGFPIAAFKSAGSSLKFCLVAAGEADLYPRAGRTMEWDTAAGQAVLAAAGGSVTRWDGAPLTYGKPGFENPAFIARGLF